MGGWLAEGRITIFSGIDQVPVALEPLLNGSSRGRVVVAVESRSTRTAESPLVRVI